MHGQIRSDFVVATPGQFPSIRLDEGGKVHATWRADGGVNYGLFDSLGNEVKAPQRISSTTSTQTPRLAVNRDHAVAVWRRVSSTFNSYVVGQLITIEGDTVFGNIQFNDVYFDAERVRPDVGYVNDSTFFVVWSGNGPQTASPTTGIYGEIATNSLCDVGANLLLSDDTTDNTAIGFPRVTSHEGSENALVVWLDGFSAVNRLRGRIFSKDGSPTAPSFLIDEGSDISFFWNPSAVTNSDGDFVVGWSGETMDNVWNIYIRRFGADGTPLGPTEKISEGLVVGAAVIDIGMDIDRSFVVVWESQGTNAFHITAQRFAADGTTVGNNFKVGVGTATIDQINPSVALHSAKIYTAWEASDTVWANIVDFNNPPLSRQDRTGQIPEFFQLYQNYPNPFNPSTTIRYEVPRSSNVRIVIYSVLGEEIITLVNKEMMPGLHEVRWNGKASRGAEVTSGIYLFRLSAEGYTLSRKMALIR